MRQVEDRLQTACANWIKAEKKQHGDIIGFHVPNGGNRSKSEGARFKAQGVLAGVADLIILTDKPATVFVELKAADGRHLKSQKEFQADVTRIGFPYYIIKTDSHYEAVGELSRIIKPYRTIYKED
jgi:hypothetical protein